MAAKPMKKMTDAEKSKLKKDLKPLKNDKPALKPLKNDKPARGAKAGTSAVSKVVKVAKKAAEYTPAGMAVKGAKTIVKAARGGMSIKDENKKLAETMRNIGKADKKRK